MQRLIRAKPIGMSFFVMFIIGFLCCPAQVQAQAPSAPFTLSLPMIDKPDDDAALGEWLTNGESTILWGADMETGDMSQWAIGVSQLSTITADTRICTRPENGVSTEQAHSGSYSIKMIIETTETSACRNYRKPEPESGLPLCYGAWYYIPEKTTVGHFWNVFQFKSKVNDGSPPSVFWKVDLRSAANGDLYAVLYWRGPVPGPHADDDINNSRPYYQTKTTVPIAQWVQLEACVRQSEAYDGQIAVFQDGLLLFNMTDVRTNFEGGTLSWSVNQYGRTLTPNPNTLYIDDVVISTGRVTEATQ
ncbi:MAG: hypothetical protein IT328_14205 [Caldilineaceae bacterium]|nr:hypothetical protein [Caldilineaceae bacterium]